MSSENIQDNDYVSRSGQEGGIPVVSDSKVESGISGRGADSDEQLGTTYDPLYFARIVADPLL